MDKKPRLYVGRETGGKSVLSEHSIPITAMTASFEQTTEKTVGQTVAKHASLQGGLLPCLHEIQAELGYIPDEHLENIATAFSLSTAEVHGVVSFYHDFRTSPSVQQSIQICCAEACQASGSRELEYGVAGVLGVEFDETHPTDNYRLERVYCLGNCACGPSVRINDDVYGRVDLASLPQLVSEAVQS
jgi:formate dehydrogenase subunit gamma